MQDGGLPLHAMVLILIPTRFEAGSILNIVQGRQKRRLAGLSVWEGRLGDKPVAVGLCRVALPLAAKAAEQLLAHYEPTHVLLAGFAGGLDPALRRGDVIEVEASALASTIATVPGVVATVEEKTRLWQETGCRIVEMEASGVAAVASDHGLPLTVLRVISDAAAEAIPSDTLRHGYDIAAGRETPLRMARHLAAHPRAIGALKPFLAGLRPCRERLAEAVREWVSKLPG